MLGYRMASLNDVSISAKAVGISQVPEVDTISRSTTGLDIRLMRPLPAKITRRLSQSDCALARYTTGGTQFLGDRRTLESEKSMLPPPLMPWVMRVPAIGAIALQRTP